MISKKALAFLLGKTNSGFNNEALAEIFLDTSMPGIALESVLGITKLNDVNSKQTNIGNYRCWVKDTSLIKGIVYYHSEKEGSRVTHKMSIEEWNSLC